MTGNEEGRPEPDINITAMIPGLAVLLVIGCVLGWLFGPIIGIGVVIAILVYTFYSYRQGPDE